MFHTIVPLIFVLTGTANILLIKWSDNMTGECSDGKVRRFQHPIVQTWLMFIGEFLCFVLYKTVYFVLQRRGDYSENENFLTRGNRDFPLIKLLMPAIVDVLASIMLFTGLYLTYATSFQMLRGAAIIFLGIFSVIYLNQTLTLRHWMALLTIICALIIVISIDLNRVLFDNISIGHSDANAILTGDLLVLCAQVLHAFKYVYEEKHIKDYDIPALQAVGWQGIFGICITSVLAVFMHFLPMPAPLNQNSKGVLDDLQDILAQLLSNSMLLVPLLSFVVLCACYNFISLHIVKVSSAANRHLADSLRLTFVWVFALLLNWELFNIPIFFALILLQMGAIDYRRAIFLEWYRSLLARLAARRYANLEREQGIDGGAQATNQAADII